MNTPKLGPCNCRKGIQRDNCSACEGTGMAIDFKRLREMTINPSERKQAFDALTVPAEQIEHEQALSGLKRPVVTLKRTFNMNMPWGVERYWRVTGPVTHRNYMSDLSIDGLKEWGIL